MRRSLGLFLRVQFQVVFWPKNLRTFRLTAIWVLCTQHIDAKSTHTHTDKISKENTFFLIHTGETTELAKAWKLFFC